MLKAIAYLRAKNLVPILVLYYSVGIAGLVVPVTRDLFQNLTPFSLVMSLILLLVYHDRHDARFWLISIAIFLSGIVVEIIGVNTGLIFGEYTYGRTLGPKIIHTPILIGVNWLLLVYCSLTIVDRFIQTPYFRAIGAAALMVVYDFALEPAAIQLDMWSWTGGAVPLQNYLAWFAIAFVFSYAGDRFQLVARENKLAQPLFLIQLGFFIVLDILIFALGSWDL